MENQPKPSFLRRAVGRIVTLTGTVAVVGLAGGAVAVGTDILNERAENVPEVPAADIASVATDAVRFVDHYAMTRQFLGQVEAGADAVLSFELGGKLEAFTIEEGDSIEKGTVIGQLGTDLLEAEAKRLKASRRATSAQLEFAETRLKRATELRQEGFSSQETLDQARATRDELQSRIDEVEAALLTVEINLEKSVLRAPFTGRVGSKTVESGETVSAGQPVLALIETTAPIVRVGLPLSVTRTDLQSVEVRIEGTAYTAKLKQLRPDVDPVTRTRTALFAVDMNHAPTFGQTAMLHIETQVPAKGAWVPIDALQQGSGSIWTVLVVEDGTVRTAAVEVLHVQSNRAFVQGSFAEGAAIIRTGAHRVVPGQQVSVLAEKG